MIKFEKYPRLNSIELPKGDVKRKITKLINVIKYYTL